MRHRNACRCAAPGRHQKGCSCVLQVAFLLSYVVSTCPIACCCRDRGAARLPLTLRTTHPLNPSRPVLGWPSRYSLEEVLGNTHWLDDRWAEKERLLSYFSRHQVCFVCFVCVCRTVCVCVCVRRLGGYGTNSRAPTLSVAMRRHSRLSFPLGTGVYARFGLVSGSLPC